MLRIGKKAIRQHVSELIQNYLCHSMQLDERNTRKFIQLLDIVAKNPTPHNHLTEDRLDSMFHKAVSDYMAFLADLNQLNNKDQPSEYFWWMLLRAVGTKGKLSNEGQYLLESTANARLHGDKSEDIVIDVLGEDSPIVLALNYFEKIHEALMI